MAGTKRKNTTLSEKELEHFKNLLLDERSNTKQMIENYRNAQSDLDEAEEADHSSQTHHMGDVGTEEQETEMNYMRIDKKLEYLNHIDDALERIENNTYGICQATGKPISKKRLEAVPHTRYSMEAKEQGLVQDS